MPHSRVPLRVLALLGLLAAVSASVGCSGPGGGVSRGVRYLKYRAEGLAETFDIGLMFSSKPTIAVYGCFASIVCLGYSDVEGHVLGLAGGRIGWIGHSSKCYGAMYSGREDVVGAGPQAAGGVGPELALKGASLDELRDYCNSRGIPARRGPHWSSSTWRSLLQRSSLLKHCGFEVWNVHRKNGGIRPVSEWEIVENAHEALITKEEARLIAQVRGKTAKARRMLLKGSMAERKRFLRPWVGRIELAPTELQVAATYQLPEPVMIDMVAGARYAAEKKTLLDAPLLSATSLPHHSHCPRFT